MKTPAPAIAGIDEAGRGALAGPVVAGACILPCPVFRRRGDPPRWSPFEDEPDADCLIADSKQLTPHQRDIAFAWITAHCPFGVGLAPPQEVERLGILGATELAMQRALAELRSKASVEYLLVDGRDKFWFDCVHSSVIRGDESEPCIAAASIVAKVTRDRMMIEAANEFPLYGFDGHKGYGAETHIAAIRAHGPCPIHRRSFLKRVLQGEVVVCDVEGK